MTKPKRNFKWQKIRWWTFEFHPDGSKNIVETEIIKYCEILEIGEDGKWTRMVEPRNSPPMPKGLVL
jgi:hypothetical protein